MLLAVNPPQQNIDQFWIKQTEETIASRVKSIQEQLAAENTIGEVILPYDPPNGPREIIAMGGFENVKPKEGRRRSEDENSKKEEIPRRRKTGVGRQKISLGNAWGDPE